MSNHDFTAQYLQKSLSYEEYLSRLEKIAAVADPLSLPENDRQYFPYYRLNYQRTRRIHKSYRPSEQLTRILSSIRERQLWLVITEPWCGDSAQILPYISEMARVNDKIELRVISRDEHPEVMDRYLTNGKRAIPKLVAFDRNGGELFTWGPRPEEAAEVYRQALEAGLEKAEINAKLHLWYGRNRGRALDKEFVDLYARKLSLAG